MNITKKVQYLTELEAALRDDADMTRAQAGEALTASGKPVRLNLDEAADAVAELRTILGAREAVPS